MQLCNYRENALLHWNNIPDLHIGISVQPMSNILFLVRHIFQFWFWPHRRNCHVILRQHATLHQYRITRGGDNDILSIFKMTAAVAQFYYRRNNSIHGRDITISDLQKQTSAVLKFFFRFRLWPHHRNPHNILHKVAKLHPYRTTQCGNRPNDII